MLVTESIEKASNVGGRGRLLLCRSFGNGGDKKLSSLHGIRVGEVYYENDDYCLKKIKNVIDLLKRR
jgi:hypothetical protein